MFLTQLKLTHQDMIDFRITDDYSIHKIVYSCFDRNDGNRILYVDKGFQRTYRILWILSRTKPQVSLGKFETREVSPEFLNHTRFAFEILLNPVKRSKECRKLMPIFASSQKEETEKGKNDLLDWFFKKAEENGFQPDKNNLKWHVKFTQKFPQKNNSNRLVVHNKILFSGTLTVTDSELFRNAFENGIGRAKAFGFGLLQLVPIFD